MSSTKKSTYKDFKMKCHGKDSFSIGKDTIDLRYVEQIADKEQTAALGELLRYAQEYLIDGKRTVSEIISILQNNMEKNGFSNFSAMPISPVAWQCHVFRKSFPVLIAIEDHNFKKELSY